MTDQPDPGWDSAEFRCGRCGTAIYSTSHDRLIEAVAQHKRNCGQTWASE
jgi:hypothetical protein